jgi:hypothetical protein
MSTYVLNLIEGGRVESGLDSGDDLDAMLDEQVRLGWEDDADRLPRGVLTIAEGETGPIAATITWVAVEGQEWADLVVHILATGEVRRYRRVEEDPVYGSRRVA